MLRHPLRRTLERLVERFGLAPSPPSRAPVGRCVADDPTLAAEREFVAAVDRFGGLFEPLYWACTQAPDDTLCREALTAWDERLTHAEGDALLARWQALRSAQLDTLASARDWLEMLTIWGVERDARTSVRLDDQNRQRYRVDAPAARNARVQIELPSWTFRGRVIERGLAHAVAADMSTPAPS
jgi:hypothetical protein